MDLASSATTPATGSSQPLPLRWAARIVSVIFHPIFIPVYLALFLVYELRLFPGRTDWQQKLIVIMFLLYYTFLPLVTVGLMKGLGFIDSVMLRSQKDRILPYVICEIFYFWGWYVFKNMPDTHPLLVVFGLGVFLASSLGLILNAYMKVSMHGLSVGVLVAFVMLASLQVNLSFGLYIAAALLIAGLTCTARLIDSDHSQREVYTGFFAGLAMQLIAAAFV